MRRIVILGLLSLLPLAVPAALAADAAKRPSTDAQYPVVEDFSADVRKASLGSNPTLLASARVLVGVDILGRVAVAIDSNRDTFVDEYVLFTDQTRLAGPWSQLLEDAVVFVTAGSLRIEARDRSLGVALAVEDAALPELGARKKRLAKTLVRSSGIALVRERTIRLREHP